MMTGLTYCDRSQTCGHKAVWIEIGHIKIGAGATGWITKPFKPEQLLAVATKLLRK